MATGIATTSATVVDTWQDVRCQPCDKKIGRIRYGIAEFQCKKCGKVYIVRRDSNGSIDNIA